MTTAAQAINRTVTLDDSQRTHYGVWTRVMGYHRPISSFDIGKQGKLRERRFLVEDRAR